MRLNPVVFVAAGAVFSAPALADQSSKVEEETLLTDLKVREWREIYDTGDADSLDWFLADDFVLIGGSDGFTPKAAEVSSLRENGGGLPQDFLYHVEDIVWVNEDAVIIYGRGTSTRTDDKGAPCNHSYLSSNVLRRDGDRWRPVSSHVSDAQCTLIAEQD